MDLNPTECREITRQFQRSVNPKDRTSSVTQYVLQVKGWEMMRAGLPPFQVHQQPVPIIGQAFCPMSGFLISAWFSFGNAGYVTGRPLAAE